MKTVIDIFNLGPQAVLDWFAQLSGNSEFDDMDVKRLGDTCWTRASTLAKAHPSEAREWAKAALAGYEFLSEHGKPFAAESARENAAALRSWKFVSDSQAAELPAK